MSEWLWEMDLSHWSVLISYYILMKFNYSKAVYKALLNKATNFVALLFVNDFSYHSIGDQVSQLINQIHYIYHLLIIIIRISSK